jgi:protein-S-isoprenylcysteine O-methyltransferase Ste14
MNKGRILVGVQFAALAVLIFYPGKKVSDIQSLIGTAIEILGAVLLILGLINLRDSLKITPEPKADARFINTGIYKYIRHPIYSGLIVFGISEVVNKATVIIVAAFVVLLFDLVIKFRYEDSLLLKVYPEAASYQKEVGALFPKLF